jgi:DNA-binding XRE family transcriptional regulator
VTPTRIEITRPQSVPPLAVGLNDAARLLGISLQWEAEESKVGYSDEDVLHSTLRQEYLLTSATVVDTLLQPKWQANLAKITRKVACAEGRDDMAKRRIPTDLAETLRVAIRDSGLSARKLADLVDVKQQTLSTFLVGQADIRISTAQKLMDHFKLTVTGTAK